MKKNLTVLLVMVMMVYCLVPAFSTSVHAEVIQTESNFTATNCDIQQDGHNSVILQPRSEDLIYMTLTDDNKFMEEDGILYMVNDRHPEVEMVVENAQDYWLEGEQTLVLAPNGLSPIKIIYIEIELIEIHVIFHRDYIEVIYVYEVTVYQSI